MARIRTMNAAGEDGCALCVREKRSDENKYPGAIHSQETKVSVCGHLGNGVPKKERRMREREKKGPATGPSPGATEGADRRREGRKKEKKKEEEV